MNKETLKDSNKLISFNLNEKIIVAHIDNILSQSNQFNQSKKRKVDKNKINRAISSFWDNFDENNIPKANKELSDLLTVAMFNPIEKKQFLENIRKELKRKCISLDSIG